MGIFRVILALSVLLTHAGGFAVFSRGGIYHYSITGGLVAVQCFYIISGFYMSLILNDKYTNKKSSLFLFYTNRMFRLMPLYCFFLIVSIGFTCIFDYSNYKSIALLYFIDYFKMLDISSKVYVIATHILVIGQDLSFFLGINPHTGGLSIDSTSLIHTTDPVLWGFYFIPQSWTLSLEFCFYLLVPFFVKRINSTILVILLSFMIRIVIYSMGYNFDPWTYRFFPFELAMFLSGTLSHKLYLFLKHKKIINNVNSLAVSGIILILTFCYPLLPQRNSFPYFFNDAQLLYYTIVVLGLPFIFQISRSNKIDRFIGELSYPIYLCHLIIIPLFGEPYAADKSPSALLYIICLSIALSVVSVIVIQRHVDNYRQRRYQIMARTCTVAVDPSHPPMEMFDTNKKIIGYDIDLMNAVAKNGGFSITYINTTKGEMFKGLESGNYNAICSSIAITDQLKKKYDFSLPYIKMEQVLIVAKTSGDVNKLDDMKGKKMGAQVGTTGALEVQKMKNVELKNYSDINLAFKELAAGRIEGVVCDNLITADYFLHKKEYKDIFVIAGAPFAMKQYGIVVKKGDDQFLNLINKGIKSVQMQGIIHKLKKKWFDKS